MTQHVVPHHMPAETVVALLDVLDARGARPCLGGGWSVDALLGEQTRRHGDLDLWLSTSEADGAIAGLVGAGVDRLLPVPGDRPWNFVLHDGGKVRVDLHFYEALDDATLHYGSVTSGEEFPAAALLGEGRVLGRPVRCEDPAWAVRWHTGYPLRDVDRHDVPLLCERFGVTLPAAYRRRIESQEES